MARRRDDIIYYIELTSVYLTDKQIVKKKKYDIFQIFQSIYL